MPTLDWIAGQEPSTISFKVRTVTQNQNSTVMHQEVLTIGGSESTLALAAVVDTTPGSTAWGLAVREVAHSTTVNVSSLGGVVVVRSSAANALVSVYQSTAADLNVTVAGYSTTVNVSSLGGVVTQRPSDTNWASSAGFHFNSSGELQTVATVTTSTTVNVSSLAGAVIMRSSAANALVSVYQSTAADLQATVAQASTTWAVQLTNYSTVMQVSSLGGIVAVRPSDTNWASSAGFRFNSSGELLTVAAVTTSTTVNVSSLAGRVTTAPSDTNWASSAGFHFDSSGYLQTVASFTGSTIVTISTGSVRVHQSTAADLNVTVAGYSTTANVSSLAGRVTTAPNDTNWASSAGFHFDSSGALKVATLTYRQVWGTAQTVINSSVDIAAGNFSGAPAAEFNNTNDTAVPYARWAKAMGEFPDWAAAPVAGTTIDLYGVLKDVDGTDDDTDAPASTAAGGARYFGSWIVAAADALQRRTITIDLLGVEKCDFYVKNGTAQNMNNDTGTNVVVKITPFSMGIYP